MNDSRGQNEAPGLFSPEVGKIDITTRLTYNLNIRLELVLRCEESPGNWIRLYKVTPFYEPTSSKEMKRALFILSDYNQEGK